MSELITVPTFVFEQGMPGDEDYDQPISVQYYSESLRLEQIDGAIDIPYSHLDRLIKEIKKHRNEALQYLNGKV